VERGTGGLLEEGPSAGFVFEHAVNPQQEPLRVGESRSGALMGEAGEEIGQRLEKEAARGVSGEKGSIGKNKIFSNI
jgi:hypothetical protein